MKNDSGFSGGYVAILAVLITGAIIMIYSGVFFNEILTVNDNFAQQNLLTERAYNYYESQTSIIKFLPVIIIFACLAWGYVYALEHRGIQ